MTKKSIIFSVLVALLIMFIGYLIWGYKLFEEEIGLGIGDKALVLVEPKADLREEDGYFRIK